MKTEIRNATHGYQCEGKEPAHTLLAHNEWSPFAHPSTTDVSGVVLLNEKENQYTCLLSAIQTLFVCVNNYVWVFVSSLVEICENNNGAQLFFAV